jgi:hypothetical protein
VVRHFNLSITYEEDSSFMRKRVNRYWVLLCVIALGLSLGAKVSYADTPGKHPSYLHALTDLRYARAYLDKLAADDQIDNDSMRAIREIDAAIGEIKRASIDDGKDLSDHPKIDTGLRRTDRFHKAIELLNKAHSDVNKEEDDARAVGLKDRAMVHIDEAHHAVEQAISAALH